MKFSFYSIAFPHVFSFFLNCKNILIEERVQKASALCTLSIEVHIGFIDFVSFTKTIWPDSPYQVLRNKDGNSPCRQEEQYHRPPDLPDRSPSYWKQPTEPSARPDMCRSDSPGRLLPTSEYHRWRHPLPLLFRRYTTDSYLH